MMEIPEEMLGPHMTALRDDRQRRFAFIMACGETNGAKAAREAGYSDHLDSAKVSAFNLTHNPKILNAIEEVSRKVLRGLAPVAINAAKNILEDKSHFAHAKMIEVVLDRTGFSAKTEHTVNVNHSMDTTELVALARRLALENGIAPERFIGVNGLGGPAKVIEHRPDGAADEEVNDVSRETVTDSQTNEPESTS